MDNKNLIGRNAQSEGIIKNQGELLRLQRKVTRIALVSKRRKKKGHKV